MDNLVILIPVFNEEKTIGTVIKNLRNYNLFIINDGSSDKTKSILKKYENHKKIEILNLDKNYGYEYALLKGFKILLNKNFKYILTCDGDNQHNTNNIKKILLFTSQNNIDLTIGNRNNLNRFVEKILSFFFIARYGICDPISGFKLYDTKCLREVLSKIRKDNTFLISIVFEFIKKSKKIKNFRIKTKKRKGSRVGNSLSLNIKILRQIKFCFYFF